MNARAYRHEATNHTAAADARREAAMRAYGRGETVKAKAHEAEAYRHEQAAAVCLVQAERIDRYAKYAAADGIRTHRAVAVA
jgi:hypothetical protein